MTSVLGLGYEKRDLTAVLAVLKGHEIRHVVDVRQRAQSRRPQFNKRALEAALEAHGFSYTHVPALGCSQELRQLKREGGRMVEYRRGYRALIKTRGSELEALVDRARRERIALLCMERDAADCHRSVLAEILEGRGFRVVEAEAG